LPVMPMSLALTREPSVGWVITKNKAVGVVVGGSVGVVVVVEVGFGVGVGIGVDVTVGEGCCVGVSVGAGDDVGVASFSAHPAMEMTMHSSSRDSAVFFIEASLSVTGCSISIPMIA